MDNLVTYTLSVFMGFFAIMNPIAIMPMFIGLTDGEDRASKRKISKTACITAFLVVVVTVIGGKYIFELFGITIPAFKITGGMLIFYVGFEMLMSKKSKIQSSGIPEKNNIAISPLAIPILAGPGTIVTAMNSVTNATYIHMMIVIVVFAVMIYLTHLAFNLSDLIVKKVGDNMISVIGKLMGLILAIMGMGMIIQGIKLAFFVVK